ncbi:MAG: hypothetical protein M3Z05_07540 [Gemmatimonadota bacterium]|nr:hypothetical protein [Gemmatimonadota bacterium]
MRIQDVLLALAGMEADGVVDRYAIGGAVGATFYLEPVATLDVDVFVTFRAEAGSLLIDPALIFQYLMHRGATMEGEYVMIGGWPVQFLPSTGPLMDEALDQAVSVHVEGAIARVFSAEHLAAIALQTGRAKDKARLLQFVESGAVDRARLQSIIARHDLSAAWKRFEQQFLGDSQ